MVYREVSVIEVKETLRLWLRGESLRSIARLTRIDRKTVRRYVEAARAAGVDRDGGEEQLSVELIGDVLGRVRPARTTGKGEAWVAIETHRDVIAGWLDDDGLTLVKVHELLSRRGVAVPYRTLHRFAATELGFGRVRATVRVADPEPGRELQVDFGRLGYLFVPAVERRRVVQGLIFTAVCSRHLFVWATLSQTLDAVIEGFEAAWGFFGGVFPVVIPDNLKAIVTTADAVAPRINDAFYEYAQTRGFVIDPARVGRPQDKPRVERAVPYVRNSFFAGEDFVDLDDIRRRAPVWCVEVAGLRVHRTTRARPLEVFELEEAPLLLPAPASRYDLPIYVKAKVHPDRHIEVGKALYSVPGELIGEKVEVRADAKLVRISHRGEVIKVHPRKPVGKRSTDAADLPDETSVYALRDLDKLQRQAAHWGPAIGGYAERLLDSPLPWTKMRQVYRLLGLARRYGASPVEEACRRALELDVVDVTRITSMLERATETADTATKPVASSVAGRFARDPSEFATRPRPAGSNGSRDNRTLRLFTLDEDQTR